METQGTGVFLTCSKVILITNLSLVIVAFGLQIVGFATYGWYIVNIDGNDPDYVNSKLSFGLWGVQFCKEDRDCEFYSVTDSRVSNSSDFKLRSAQAQTCAALALTFLSIIFIVLGRNPKAQISVPMKLPALLMVLTSGILSLVTTGEMASQYEESVNKLKGTNSGVDLEFPYSLPIFGSGGALLCIVAFILLGDIIGNCIKAAAQESLYMTKGFQSPYVVDNRQIPVNVVNTPIPSILKSAYP